MAIVLRAWGLDYENGEEIWTLCWVTKRGDLTSNRIHAQTYQSIDDAWTHAAAAELLGYDEERGDWCFPEEENVQ